MEPRRPALILRVFLCLNRAFEVTSCLEVTVVYGLIDEIITFFRGIEKFLLWLCERIAQKIQSRHRRVNNFTFASVFLFTSIILSLWWGVQEWNKGNYATSVIHPIIMLMVARTAFPCISMARQATMLIKENTFGETLIVASLRRFMTLLLVGSFYSIIFFVLTEREVPSEKVSTCAERLSWVLTLYFVSVKPLFRRKKKG